VAKATATALHGEIVTALHREIEREAEQKVEDEIAGALPEGAEVTVGENETGLGPRETGEAEAGAETKSSPRRIWAMIPSTASQHQPGGRTPQRQRTPWSLLQR